MTTRTHARAGRYPARAPHHTDPEDTMTAARRTRAQRWADALTHSGPGYDPPDTALREAAYRAHAALDQLVRHGTAPRGAVAARDELAAALGTIRPEPESDGVTIRATEYVVSCIPEDDSNASGFSITVEYRGRGRWAVCRGKRCLGTDGAWSWESIPSERRDEWIATHRFDLATAQRLAREAVKRVIGERLDRRRRAGDARRDDGRRAGGGVDSDPRPHRLRRGGERPVTATPRPGDALLHLVDRVARRNILPTEIRQLRDGVAALAASNAELAQLATNAARALANERRHHEIAAEEVARLRAEARIALRTCLMPGCLRQYDSTAWATGEPTRPEWSGRGWRIAKGLLPGDERVCPDRAPLVAEHVAHSARSDDGVLTVVCTCGWQATARRWHRVARALWEEHLLDAALAAPATEEPSR